MILLAAFVETSVLRSDTVAEILSPIGDHDTLFRSIRSWVYLITRRFEKFGKHCFKVAVENDADERISIDSGKVKRGRASKERVHSGSCVKSPAAKRGLKQTDGLTDAGSLTNGLSANC